ncbi:MAG: PQQ-binding-like beta-propeller repeat protein [Halobacteriales archaeon]
MTDELLRVSRRTTLMAAGVGVAGLSGCLDTVRELNPLDGSGGWGQYRGDQRNRGRAGSGPGTDLDDDWDWTRSGEADADAGAVEMSSPVAAGGTVFVSGTVQYPTADEVERTGYVVALDAGSGDEQWREEIPWSDLPITPAVSDGTVVAAGGTAGEMELFAFDAATGDERWNESLDFFVTGALKAADGAVFVPSQTLSSVSVEDGSENWTYEAGDERVEWPNFAPAVGSDRAYLPVASEVHAIDRDDGSADWVEDIGRTSEPSGGVGQVYPPVLGEGTLYAASGKLINRSSGDLAALDPDDGDVSWRFGPDPNGREFAGAFGCPVVKDGTVFVTGREDQKPKLWALDPDDGEPEDDEEIPAVGFHVLAGGGTVYLGGGNWVGAADPAGPDLEADPEVSGGDIFASPAITDGRLVVAKRDGLVAYGG